MNRYTLLFKLSDEGAAEQSSVTSGGVARVNAGGAAKLLKKNGVLDSARMYMVFDKKARLKKDAVKASESRAQSARH